MVLITEQLIRKKSEHNELIISTLEELSLHQEDIEKIEHLHNWCRDLKILLLQSNLISKIENLYKLKKLEYLNLAMNNIELIENLEQLESLNKLDLTLNFIGDLRTSIENLKNNYNLRILILTGNPCTDYPNYRDYVIGKLKQLENLDNIEIKPSDKIQAYKNLDKIRSDIVQAEFEYSIERDEQKIRVRLQKEELDRKMQEIDNEQERVKLFWNTKSENCPETRCDISKQHRKGKNLDGNSEKKVKKCPKLFAPCGRPYNLNQPKLDFKLLDEIDRYELELSVYKFMDTSLLKCDVQPNYVRVDVKDKIFQLHLQNEVKCSESSSKRNQITGQLLIVMPKLNYKATDIIKTQSENREHQKQSSSNNPKDNLKGTVNYKNIVKPNEKQLESQTNSVDLKEIPALI
ncbi:protein tilB [Condylostylus longicornis]|uniref:protein tilB n=1 Tax=Condylostylus longicornis TaxID=2530218 RepID=UPI00244DD813|nr:protein tilB [Condylostylus longicornis]